MPAWASHLRNRASLRLVQSGVKLDFGRMFRGALIVGAGSLVTVLAGCAGQQPALLQGYAGTAIVSSDGRTLIVGPYGLQCGDTVTVVAQENRAKVSLFVQYMPGGPACFPGEGAMAMVPEQHIQLRAALAHRKLVDGKTGTATQWLSARLVLRPRFIPAGFRSTGLLPWMSSSLYPDGVRSAACMQIYHLRNRVQEFEIIQSAAGLQLQHRGGWKPIRVRGQPGQAAAGVITWREEGLTNFMSASEGLTTAQLIAIADSAPLAR